MNKLEIGQIIQKRRNFLAINQEDLSEMTAITSKTIYLIESGKGNPSIDTLNKLLDVLGLEISIDIKKMNERKGLYTITGCLQEVLKKIKMAVTCFNTTTGILQINRARLLA